MSGLSVIIPSRTAGNLIACADAVRKHEPHVRIIVIDDGLNRFDAPQEFDVSAWINRMQPIEHLLGVQPFIFARNVNLGIQRAGDDDVVLLNDDALLEDHFGLTGMQYAAQQDSRLGLVSATTNLAGNPAQLRRAGARACRECPSPTPGNSFATVAFICVLIPRRTINAIGLLDERFGGTTPEGKRIYGYCDGDYCRRVHLAGLKIGIHDGCYLDHNKLPSSFRSPSSDPPIDMEAARQIYLKKWGHM